MNRQQQRALERQTEKMSNRIVGPGGVPIIGGAQQPPSPFLDIKPDENGPTFRLPVVALGFIPPDQVALLAQAIAPLVAEFILNAAKEETAPLTPYTSQ